MFNSDFVIESVVDGINIALWAIGAITVTVGAVKGVVKIVKNVSNKVKEYDSKTTQQQDSESALLEQLMSDPSLLAAVQQIINDKQDNVVHVVDAEAETA